MPNVLESTLLYLKNEKFSIDLSEFNFQFQSHPDFPSLLSLSDTLKFFHISNGVFKVEEAKIDYLPSKFIAKVNIDNSRSFVLIEKNGEGYNLKNSENKKMKWISKKTLKSIWGEIVLLIESDQTNESKRDNLNVLYLLGVPFFLLLAQILQNSFVDFRSMAFYIFPLLGFLFSLHSQKDLFRTNNELWDRFCGLSSNFDCDSIIKSSKWEILKKINLSDLSITFFSTQVLGLFLFGILDNFAHFFTIQYAFTILAIPIIGLSLYYQKFVEKKWCPICLTIATIVILELVFIGFYLKPSFYNINLNSITLYAFVYVSILIIWNSLKGLLDETKRLKESELETTRLIRNYEVFKNTLVSKDRYKLPGSSISFGNIDAKLRIDIVTSPLCGHCEDAHEVTKRLLDLYGERLSINLIFNYNIEKSEDKDRISLYRNLIRIKLRLGNEAFYEAIESWYNTKEYSYWNNKFAKDLDFKEVDSILKEQHNWCVLNKMSFTPCLFINGYKYPRAFYLTNSILPYYIEELLDDDSL